MKNMCVTCIKCKDEIQYSGFYSMEKANNILHFCSEECLDKNLTKEEYLEMYADGEGDSYWTEWECSTAGGMMKCLKL